MTPEEKQKILHNTTMRGFWLDGNKFVKVAVVADVINAMPEESDIQIQYGGHIFSIDKLPKSIANQIAKRKIEEWWDKKGELLTAIDRSVVDLFIYWLDQGGE